MKIEIPETRGAKTKYDFDGLKVGETRKFEGPSVGTLINCAKSYCKQRELKWKVRCYTLDGIAHIVRIK